MNLAIRVRDGLVDVAALSFLAWWTYVGQVRCGSSTWKNPWRVLGHWVHSVLLQRDFGKELVRFVSAET